MTFTKSILPALIWTAIIIFLLVVSVPSSADIPKIRIPHFDKIVHFGLFMILAFLYAWGFKKQRTHIALIKFAFYFAVFIAIVIGIITELIQAYWIPTRNGDVYDLLADTFGVFFGILLFPYAYNLIEKFFFKGKKAKC